jgi:hypothetical protein
MKQPIAARALCVLVLSQMLFACATRPAPGISGRWKAVNHYAATPEEIPLYQTYVFYPSPMDRTLKAMLARWAQDSKMTLSYQHPSDFSLFEPVAQIRTSNLQEAAAMLTSLYAAQHVSVTVRDNAIVVRRTDRPVIEPAGDPVSAPVSAK